VREPRGLRHLPGPTPGRVGTLGRVPQVPAHRPGADRHNGVMGVVRTGLGLVLAGGLAACGVAPGSGPQVAVTPASQLTDGQSVVVRVTGFGAGRILYVSECATAASANGQGCGSELARQMGLVTADDQAGEATFIVQGQAQAGPFNTGAIEACSDQCVIVATLGDGDSFAYARIGFEAP